MSVSSASASAARALRPNPSALFDFNSIAVIGASDDPTRIGGATLVLLKKYGYTGVVYGVNPKYTEVQGVPCVAGVDDLPDGIEVVVFCVGADRLKDMLPVLCRKGLKAAVVYSAGFGESGAEGRQLQDWLRDYAQAHGIAILGPNCVGQVSFTHGRAMTFTSSLLASPAVPAGRTALLSQSGGVATNILADGLVGGARFSHLITTGNEAGLTLTDFLHYLAQDPHTDVVLGYLEGLNDGAAFCEAAAAMRTAGKPLIMMRVGVSQAGQAAAASHTGQLSSDDAGYQSAFDRYGVIRVDTLQALNDHARVFGVPDIRPAVTVVTTSGGAGVYAADLCDRLGIPLCDLAPETEAALSEVVPSYGRVQNPVDLTAQVVNDMSILRRSLHVLLDDPGTGVLLFLLSGKGTPEQSSEAIALFQQVQRETDKLIVLCWLGVAETVRIRAAEAGLMVLHEPERFLRPLRAYWDFRQRLSDTADTKPDEAEVVVLADPSEALRAAAVDKVVPEKAALTLLEQVGVRVPARKMVRDAADIPAAMAALRAPYVMKLADPVVAHKSDVGGVRVGLADAAAVEQVWADMRDRLGAREVMLVEQAAAGTEILVGCVRDATFGMRLIIGSGGIWTNALQDTVTLIPPFTDAEIRRVLPRLAAWSQLSGGRGQAPMAIDALVDAIQRIGAFALAGGAHLQAFECNPIIVTQDDAVVVDAVGFLD